MLEKLEDNASVWIFQSDRKLNDTEINTIRQQLDIFIPEWSAHGTNLKSEYEIIDDLFIVVGVDENYSEASGCSKDALTRKIKSVGESIEVDFFNRLNTAYIDDEGVLRLANIVEFKQLVQQDNIRRNTTVFNNLVETKAELKSKWKVELKDSWHNNLVIVQ